MKKGTMKEKQTSKYKGFYTAIGISILMIGAACVYAYQVTMETNQTLENELSQTAEETQPTTNFIQKSMIQLRQRSRNMMQLRKSRQMFP